MTSTAPALKPSGRLLRRPAHGGHDALSTAVREPGTRRRALLLDLAVCVAFLLFAAWLTHGLWPDPSSRTLALNPADQILYEWFLAHDTMFWTGGFSLVSDRLNAPDGVNLLANTTVIALGALFTPVTLAFGAPVTFALIVALNLAGTGITWFLFFRRTMGASRAAATVGGAFCGFAPGMVSQSNSHLHITAQWLIPAIVWCVVVLVREARRPDGSGRRGVAAALLLGLLVAVQLFIGEETLFLTSLTLLLVAVVYAVRTRPARAEIGRFAAVMAIAVGFATVLLAYPLWIQFKGPQSVRGGVFSPHFFSADLAGFVAISPLSVGGSESAAALTTGAAEYNTFFGWPLALLALGLAGWLWRDAVALSCSVAALLMCGLALGPEIVVDGERTPVNFLFTLMESLPVVDGALPMRFALAAIPLLAVLLVLALDRARAVTAQGTAAQGTAARGVRFGVPALVLISLAPLTPLPLPTAARAPVPRFYTEGHWRECVPEGGVLVPVPLATPPLPEPMRFATANQTAFSMPEGFFIGPFGANDKAIMGTFRRPTSALLNGVMKTGTVPLVDDGMRMQARADLRRWKADCVVLTDSGYREQLDQTLRHLLGPGTDVADATVWPRTW